MEQVQRIPNLRISLIQIDIESCNKEANITKVKEIISSLKDKSDIAILPEAFNTGFENKAYKMYETEYGDTLKTLQSLAINNNIAIISSFFVQDKNENIYNRLYFIEPKKGNISIQDKRHLFSIAKENKYISSTNTRSIIEYKGWRILPTICYDIRFPVWCRNVNNEYDILVNIANWPSARQEALTTFIKARALENLCYVVSVNRCGRDMNNIEYKGCSSIIDYKSRVIAKAKSNEEDVITSEINYNDLQEFREKFPVYKDADNFVINSVTNTIKE